MAGHLTRGVDDVAVLAVPPQIDCRDPAIAAALPEYLAGNVEAATWNQYPQQFRPERLEMVKVEFLITDAPLAVAAWQPAHPCEECKKGPLRALEYLRDHPGNYVALGNIAYIEHWGPEVTEAMLRTHAPSQFSWDPRTEAGRRGPHFERNPAGVPPQPWSTRN